MRRMNMSLSLYGYLMGRKRETPKRKSPALEARPFPSV